MRLHDSVRLRALLSLGIVAGFGAVGTLAAWSDDATATAQFTAGTINLTLNGDPDDAVELTSLSMSNMYPGSSKAAALTVGNDGTLPFSYNVKTTAAGNASLGSALIVAIAPGEATADGASCVGTALPAASASLSGTSLSAARPLIPKANERLCIKVTLPSTADTALQGTTTTATFTFTATQAN